MRDYRDYDDSDDPLPYRRPALSAWVAAAAVAVAVFMLGGFIKTYRQLEALREDSRREIQELRQAISALQQDGRLVLGQPSRQAGIRVTPLPRAESRPAPPSADVASAESLRPGTTPQALIPEIDQPERRVTYAVGRRSSPEELGGPQGQVTSVSATSKRLMVEGGRDVSLEPGARLEVYRDGRWVGDLRVLDVYENQSACEVLHSTSTPLPGDMVRRPLK